MSSSKERFTPVVVFNLSSGVVRQDSEIIKLICICMKQ